MNFNLARHNMVQQQVRTWNVSNPRVLDLMSNIPREQFVPSRFQQLAFSDSFIPMGSDQVMLPPKIVGRILQDITIDKRSTVLEIGTGTGYITAILCQMAKKVISLEIFPELANKARHNLKTLQLHNIVLEVGDGIQGATRYAPFDAILLSGAMPVLPKSLGEQLAINGRLFAVVGTPPAMSAIILTRIDKERWVKQTLFETNIPLLINAPTQKCFQF